MEMARLGYQPEGYVVDFVIIPDSGTPNPLQTGVTYYIKTSYSSGSSVTFEPGCFIKYKNNAYMLLYGPISFPVAGQTMPVLTSRNDNNFGQVIPGVAGEADSNGDPTLHKAAQALWIYFVNSNTTIGDARIRWAQRGIQYDANPGVSADHYLSDSVFQYCTSGIYCNVQSGTLNLTNVKKCTVTTPIVIATGKTRGTVTDDCGVVSIARVNPDSDTSGDPNKDSQSECSFVVVDATRIVGAFFDTHMSAYGLGNIQFPGIISPRSTGWAVSVNGGASFTDNGAIPPAAPANTTQGDAGDPVMARDTGNGTIYLLTNPSREISAWGGFRLWKSTDNGQTLALVSTSVPAGVANADKPMIAVNNFSGSANYHHLYVAGAEALGSLRAFVSRSIDGGATWDAPHYLSGQGNGAELAIGPDGTAYVFYLVNGSGVGLWYSWRRSGDTEWHTALQISAHGDSSTFYSINGNGSGNPKRSNSADEADYFVSNAFPRAAVNPVNGRVYLVYADLPFPGSSTDRGDIFANEGVAQADGSLIWTGARRVNNDGTATDQWNPSIAINPAGTELFVGYYSRQEDSVNNALIRAYGAKTMLANGFATATFDVFPISATAFPPLFPGTTLSTPPANTWMYDPVWPQTGVCLDGNVIVTPCPGFTTTGGAYQHFMADDYTWVSADSSYFYFAWCDRSESFVWQGHTRADPNIRMGKMGQ